MKSYIITVEVSLLLALLGIFGCTSKSYEVEDIRVDSEKIGTNNNSGIKQEIVEHNLEIKEETVNPKPIVHIYSIQIGAFLDMKNAQEFINKLKKILSYDIGYQFIDEYYKVRTGKIDNKDQASAELSKIKNLGYKDAFLIEVTK